MSEQSATHLPTAIVAATGVELLGRLDQAAFIARSQLVLGGHVRKLSVLYRDASMDAAAEATITSAGAAHRAAAAGWGICAPSKMDKLYVSHLLDLTGGTRKLPAACNGGQASAEQHTRQHRTCAAVY